MFTIDTSTNSVVGEMNMLSGVQSLAFYPEPSACLVGTFAYPDWQMQYGQPGDTVKYTAWINNSTGETLTFNLLPEGALWETSLSITNTGPLEPGATLEFTATVAIPAGAVPGDRDTLTLSIVSTSGGWSMGVEMVTAVARPGYVFLSYSDQVGVLDTIAHENTGNTFDLQVGKGSWPWRGALSPDGASLYVSLAYQDQVAVFDLSNPISPTLVDVGAMPHGIAFSPDGARAFVANRYDNSLSVIDTASLVVTQTVTGLATAPMSIAFSPCLDKIYVTGNDGESGNTVTVLDGTTLSVTAEITEGLNLPWGVVLSPLGERAYVSNSAGAGVIVIDTATDTVTDNWLVEGAGRLANLDISPDGSKLYVVDTQLGYVYVLDTTTGLVTSQISIGAGSGGGSGWDVQFFPFEYGSYAYATVPDPGLVRVIDTQTDQVVDDILLSDGPRGLALFPESGICGTPPAGSFTQSATTIMEGEGVVFTATISGGVPTPTTTWDFGDSSAAGHDLILTHTYTQTGMFTVSLKLENPLGQVVPTGTVTVLPIEYGVSLEPAQASAEAAPGGTVVYTLTLTNLGNVADSFTFSAQGNAWDVTLPAGPINLDVGASMQVTVTVQVPADIADGQVDVATITVTSAGDAQITASAELTTTGRHTLRRVYLPVINR